MEEERRTLKLLVEGLVQGVGFRPFIYHLAKKLNLSGYVINTREGVEIGLSGRQEDIGRFIRSMKDEAPPLASIRRVHEALLTGPVPQNFEIAASEAKGSASIFISPDIALCADCEKDFRDSGNRYHAYPFVNCTNCGPRFSIITGFPYDRKNTTMNDFAMCPACAAEYTDINSRRYHAEPVSCPSCGPEFRLLDNELNTIPADDVFETARDMLKTGAVLAVKGVGGFHLMLNAANGVAVAKLRERKKRDTKPFALLCRDIRTIEELCVVSDEERQLLLSKERPIVLLRKKDRGQGSGGKGQDSSQFTVSPFGDYKEQGSQQMQSSTHVSRFPDLLSGNSPYYGVMLPYAPFHHLLLRDTPVLVCTSGNLTGEPIVYKDDDIGRLKGIADYFLVHNRKIVRFVEDSVVKIVHSTQYTVKDNAKGQRSRVKGGAGSNIINPIHPFTDSPDDAVTIMMRKSRGYAPAPLFLERKTGRTIMGLGGDLKSSISILTNDTLFQSQYLGDLEDVQSYEGFTQCYDDMRNIFQIEPEVIVCDLHPGYHSVKFARMAAGNKPLLQVQHHKAHIAAVALEQGWYDEPILGIALDGTGYGEDGSIWGGEVFSGSLSNGFERAASLSLMPLPFGDSTVKEPGKTALSYLVALGLDDKTILPFFDDATREHYASLKQFILKSPVMTSSTGRLFDAVSYLLGFRCRTGYEGEAAIELENMIYTEFALDAKDSPYTISIIGDGALLRLDVKAILADVLKDIQAGVKPALISLRFHQTLVEGFMAIIRKLAQTQNIAKVALSGGSFQNSYLLKHFIDACNKEELQWATNTFTPPNDACISVGQCAIAAFSTKK